MRSSNGLLAMTEQLKKQNKPTWKPKCIIEYNKGMIGVDRQDQMLACFPLMRKCLKGYRKMFFYLFDVALFNSFILHKINMEKNSDLHNIRLK